MNKRVFILVLFIIQFSCQTNDVNLETDQPETIYNVETREYQLVSKWNGYQSEEVKCSACDPTTFDCCFFHYKGNRYLRSESYILDSLGMIDSIYSYKVRFGANILSIEKYGRLSKIDTNYSKNMTNYSFSWEKSTQSIIDCNDTITDFYTDSKRNQLFTLENGILEIYKYE